MDHISKHLQRSGNSPSPKQSGKSTEISQKGNSETGLQAYTPQHRQALADSLGACLAVQRTYGKQAGDLKAITGIFMQTLAEHRPEDVVDAIRAWLLKSQNFPTPADIVGILNPDNASNRDVYQRIVSTMRTSPESLRQWEWNYITRYEMENR